MDTLQAEFDRKHSARQSRLLAVQWVGALVLRVLCYALALGLYWRRASAPVASVALLEAAVERRVDASWLLWLLAAPKGERGTLSTFVWAVASAAAARELSTAFIW